MPADAKSGLIRGVKIYYFSGTGNARNVALWIANIAEKQAVKSEVVNLAVIDKSELRAPVPGELIGFCSPTHGFNFPPVTLKFLWHFPRGKNKVFIINTRAGIKLWKFHLCGLSGLAQIFSALLLKIKGYSVVGMHPVDLPSNWISIHPGLREKVVDSIFIHCKRNTERFAHRIFAGKRSYRALFDIIQDLAIAPVGIAYYLIGRFVLAKTFVASRSCSACGLCITSCPVGAIKYVDKRPYWTFKCESCMKCMNSCPERAIHTAHGFVIGTMYMVFTVVMECLYFISVDKLPSGIFKAFLENGSMKFLIASLLAIPFLWLAYRIVHFFMRYSFVERLVIYTSLTIFKFWRRYKAPPVY